jgi:hypothetical protein
MMQFFRCAYSGSLNESRFAIYNQEGEGLKLTDIVRDTNKTTQLCYNKPIVINYADEPDDSFLKLKEDCVDIYLNGYCNPEQIGITGSMGVFRVGDMLPFDYE